jgi:hypothetical protein
MQKPGARVDSVRLRFGQWQHGVLHGRGWETRVPGYPSQAVETCEQGEPARARALLPSGGRAPAREQRISALRRESRRERGSIKGVVADGLDRVGNGGRGERGGSKGDCARNSAGQPAASLDEWGGGREERTLPMYMTVSGMVTKERELHS